MTPAPDHETVSALLRGHLEGSLDDPTAAAVEAHLASCRHCEAELRAVVALARAREEPMTDVERARLRAAVAHATGAPTAPRRGRSWRSGAAASLAAAALVVVVAGAGALFLGGGGTADQGDAVTAPTQEPRPIERSAKDSGGAAGGLSSARAEVGGEGPRFAAAALRADADELRRLGRAGQPFVTYRQTYRAGQAQGLEDRSLQQLSHDAPQELSAQVRECGHGVIESQGYPVVAAYGAIDELEGKRTLVLGFAWSPSPDGALDRFQLWAWPVGQCETPVSYQAGRIRP